MCRGTADDSVALGKHHSMHGIKASGNYYRRMMKDLSLQLRKRVLDIISKSLTLRSKQFVGLKLRHCLTQIHLSHQYSQVLQMNF